MKMKLLFATLLLAVFAIPAKAATAGEMMQSCRAFATPNGKPNTTDEAVGAVFCVAYISGYMDGVDGMSLVEDDVVLTIHFANDVTIFQVIRVFVKYMNAHPESENKPVVEILPKSLVEAKIMDFEKTTALPKATEQ
jgi:Rap1a immunity proteins